MPAPKTHLENCDVSKAVYQIKTILPGTSRRFGAEYWCQIPAEGVGSSFG